MKVWEVKNRTVGKLKDCYYNFGDIDYSLECSSMYSLLGTGFVSCYIFERHVIIDVEGVLKGRENSSTSLKSRNEGSIAFSPQHNVLVFSSSRFSEDRGEYSVFPLQVFKFGANFELPRENMGKQLDLYIEKSHSLDGLLLGAKFYPKITQLEMCGKALPNQVIAGICSYGQWRSEIVCLFDLTTGKVVRNMLKDKMFHNFHRSLFFDEKSQLLFTIGDEYYIEGGLKAWDFRTGKEALTSSELKELQRTYTLKIIGDDLWCGSTSDHSMNGESEESDGSVIGRRRGRLA